jgi:uncharacterized protein YgbK (DUF1537 family)
LKIAIIADDLTGANDSGVRFARSGLKTSVLLKLENYTTPEDDVIIIDTDSRSLLSEEAYRKVKEAAEFVKINPPDIIYKKIDSTLRGNIGAEFDALFDVFQPDFIVCTPAYPEYNRLVKEGSLYLGDQLIQNTEFALDPKTPITESFIPKMIMEQSSRQIGLVTLDDLSKGRKYLMDKLQSYQAENKSYLIFDAVTHQDLQQIVELFFESTYRVVWSGSAGLANCLIAAEQLEQVQLPKSDGPVMIVVGSVNQKTRRQLDILLAEPEVRGIKLLAHRLVSDEVSLEQEKSKAYREATEAINEHQHIVFYSSGEPQDIKMAQKIGAQNGLSPTAVSDKISEVLGEVASRLLIDQPIDRLILTGGDTAKQFCQFAHFDKFELIDEVETGVPIGIFSGKKQIYGVTKAGGFGSDEVLIHSLKILQGEKIICAQ